MEVCYYIYILLTRMKLWESPPTKEGGGGGSYTTVRWEKGENKTAS